MLTRSVRLLGLLTAFVVIAMAPVIADVIDDSEEAVSLYARGERLMSEGDWFHAADVFEQLTGLFPGSKNVDLFLFQRSRAYSPTDSSF
jgi:outer membrane protein assembly factor BamD (BamD/ComL family)